MFDNNSISIGTRFVQKEEKVGRGIRGGAFSIPRWNATITVQQELISFKNIKGFPC